MHDPQSLHKNLYVHGNPIMMTDPTGQFGFGLGLGLVVGLIGNSGKSFKDVSTGSTAGGTATILGFQANLKTALYLTLAGLYTAAELLRPIAEQRQREAFNFQRTGRILRRLSEGNEPELELELQDEKLPRDEAIRLGFINHYETREDEIPVFIEKLSQLYGVAMADLNAQIRGFPIVLTWHGGSVFYENNRYEAQ